MGEQALFDTQAHMYAVLQQEGLSLYGSCPFAWVADHLRPCRGAARLPKDARTVLATLFPYRFAHYGPRNLSRYACVPDYHEAAGGVLQRAAAALRAAFPHGHFEPFIDNSPIPEVRAAALAGLGVVGDHGLLIHPTFGSWVFIGTIVTDLSAQEAETVVPELPTCLHCGACVRACVTGCLKQGYGTDKTRCQSAVSQRKGALTEAEQAAMRRTGLAWGCDTCQEVCPLNRHTLLQPHPCFTHIDSLLTEEALDAPQGKAWAWRGPQVPARNLAILCSADENGIRR